VIWQAIEPSALPGDPGSNWGLLRTDMSVKRPGYMSFHITAKYYAMASFSRHLRRAIAWSPQQRRGYDHGTVAQWPRAVVIHVNHGVYARKLDLSTDGLDGAKWKLRRSWFG
jgi:hypothetical protein